MRVFVYYNLHRKMWSMKALQGPSRGRVIDHATVVSLVNVEYRVSEAGRQRVIRERKKYVHAGVVGTVIPTKDTVSYAFEGAVRYNPYEGPNFLMDGKPVKTSDAVIMYADTREVMSLKARGLS